MAELVSFLPLIAIALLFWFMVIRPASRRQKKLSQMQSELSAGSRVMLSAGIFGTVRSVTDDRLRVEIAPGTEIEVVRGAVGALAEDPATEPAVTHDPTTEATVDETTPDRRDA